MAPRRARPGRVRVRRGRVPAAAAARDRQEGLAGRGLGAARPAGRGVPAERPRGADNRGGDGQAAGTGAEREGLRGRVLV